ncbi:hypothetical protein ACRAWD_24720 [Caulobacter segnis]
MTPIISAVGAGATLVVAVAMIYIAAASGDPTSRRRRWGPRSPR